ncbi:MAG: glycosyltransferase family 2 protein [Saprospiraceae bacterium]
MLDFQKSSPKAASQPERFSIVIPTWNNLAYLQLLVRSLRENSAFRHQIIVVVNEGRDGTLDWVRAQPDLDWVFFPENAGICYALNACRPLVRTDFFAYFNDDMYACPGWDEALWREIGDIGHRSFFLSSTMIEPTETGNACVVVRNFGSEPADFQEDKLLAEFAALPKNNWQGATWPPNVVPLELWDLVGGYSVEFSPGMYSDPDFSKKLWDAGVRLFKGVGASRVYHFGSKSTRRARRNRGSDTFLRKWGIPSSLFIRRHLRRGQDWDGPLAEPVLTWADQLKIRWKKWQSLV